MPVIFDDGDQAPPVAPVRKQKRPGHRDFADHLGLYSKNTCAENLLFGMKMPNLRVELSLSAADEIK